jgi:secreted trypsin-like serine protease
MRRVLLVLAVLTGLVLTASPAGAIVNGTADGNGHPNVGGLVNDSQYSDGTWLYCSGTLISPTVFLTAAHCGDDGSRVGVTFDSAYQDGDKVHYGTFQADPAYPGPASDGHDIAVVVFDRAVKGITPAQLPKADSLSGLKSGQPITSVGYGAYEVTSGPGGHGYLYDDVRMVGVGSVNAVTGTWLRISGNEATGDGGTCYGDSGGPNFLGTTNIVASTTITGDAICRATNDTYRMDTASARAFLGGFVTLP